MNLRKLKREFENELTDNILYYWVKNVYDPKRRTFYGRITNKGEKFTDAPLTAVFTTRIMWTFAAAYPYYPTAIYHKIADEAFRIVMETFWDNENGGIYWSVNPDGTTVDAKKQFYAEAFFIYALSEYHRVFHDEKSKQLAVSMFMLMEKYALDKEFGGYFEACSADWQPTKDQYLIPQNSDVKKSMNTHLHILEAYTNLYRIWKDETLKTQLHKLVRIFLDKIIDAQTYHFHLFFDADWTVRSEIDSYGHDIEGSWLLCEAAEMLGDVELTDEVKKAAMKMVEVTSKEGLDKSGGLYYEKEDEKLNKQFDWWPQAETVVGFFNGWQVTGNESYLQQAEKTWDFIQKYIVDEKNGEWFRGVSPYLKPLPGDKVSGWKAPYHNSRMCLEMMRRIDERLE